MDRRLRLYEMLPEPLKSAAASLYGYRLRMQRYGRTTNRRIAEARDRETWSAEMWKTWRDERMAYVLNRAATRVPYYRNLWQDRRRKGDRRSWQVLENWPVLHKDDVRANPDAFVADDQHVNVLIPEPTSGTTGTPLRLYRGRNAQLSWYALHARRVLQWNGVSAASRWAHLGGRLVVPFERAAPPFWVWNQGLRQLYMSSHHLASRHARPYADAISRHEVDYLLGYPSAIYALAGFILEQDISPPALRCIISNAEPLFAYQRRVIEAAFGCAVRDTYGMGEIAAAASECDAGQMHIWPEVGLIEVLADDAPTPVAAGSTGRLIATGLLNADMPLIRYEVGDRGAREPDGTLCSCGRTLPLLKEVEGRLDDVVRTRDGRSIGRLDPVFKDALPIREAQIVQESLERFRVRLVRADTFSQEHQDMLARRLRERVGDVDISFDFVDRLPRTASGKVRGVISEL